MAGEDFVTIQLSAAGQEMAGEAGIVRVATSRCAFEFRAGEPQKVTRAYEWQKVLEPMKHAGEPMFEVVEEGETADAANCSI